MPILGSGDWGFVIGEWGFVIGDWELGIWDWGLGIKANIVITYAEHLNVTIKLTQNI